MKRSEQRLALDDAAQRLGVHYMTAYRYVRLGRLPAVQDGGKWWVKASDVDALLQEAPSPRGRRARPDWTTYRARLDGRLVAGDDVGAWSIAEQALVSGASPTDVYVELLGPVLHEIGDRWEAGTLTVEREHTATAAARRVVGRMGPRFARRGRARGTVVVGGAAGDHHELPVAMLADVLRGAAYDVVDLGANTPTESFVAAVGERNPLAVGISASTAAGVDATAKSIRALRRFDRALPVLVGGPAFPDADSAAAVRADGWAPDARAAIAELDRLRAGAR